MLSFEVAASFILKKLGYGDLSEFIITDLKMSQVLEVSLLNIFSCDKQYSRKKTQNDTIVMIPKWYHCDDKRITENNLLTLSNNVYLVFYAKEIDIGT